MELKRRYFKMMFWTRNSILVLILHTVTSGQAELQISPYPSAEAVEEKPLTLTCIYNGYIMFSQFAWAQYNGPHFSFRSSSCSFYSHNPVPNEYHYNCSSTTEFFWTINNVTNDRHGEKWGCRVNTFPDTTISPLTTIYVVVSVKNVSLVSPSENIVYVFENISTPFLCETTIERPRSTIKWFIKDTDGPFKGSIVPSDNDTLSSTSSTLHYSFDHSQTGNELYCTAVNIKGQEPVVSNSKEIRVMYPPIINGLQDITVVEDERLSISCLAASLPSPSSYSWTRSQDDFNQLSPTLLIERTRREDTDMYTCTVQNQMQPTIGAEIIGEEKAVVDVKILYHPVATITHTNGTDVTEGDRNVTLVCSAKGEPSNYAFSGWTHYASDGHTKIQERASTMTDNYNAYLVFPNIHYMDSGVYECSVSNGIRSYETGKVFATVKTSLLVKGRPIIISRGPAVIVNIYQNVSLWVTYYANNAEIPTVKWYKKDDTVSRQEIDSSLVRTYSAEVNVSYYTVKIIRPGYKTELIILGAGPSDFGDYETEISNSVDKVVATTHLIPKDPVSITDPNLDKVVTMTTGKAVEEIVIASNLHNYSWSQEPDDGSFNFNDQSYPMLVITNATELNIGVYTITVTAHGLNGSTDVRTITFTVGNPVTNEDTPAFEALQEPIKIVEWATAGTSVLQVTATDNDTTSPDNEVSYSIEGTDFTIDSTSGLVKLAAAASLDYSTKQKYELVITATDGGSPQLSASITATVTVQTRPIWSDPSPGATLQTSVKETAQHATIKTLSATDEDDDGSTPLIYKIDSQDPSGTTMFEIIGDTVYTKAGVDLDVDGDGTVSLYKLTLSVSDGENSAKSTVRIDVTVTDENDNTPTFDPDTFDESIPEFALQGASALNVSACDDDLTSPNNNITYSLQDTTAFVIDGTTGLIKVATLSILNYTAESVHKFIVTATDGGNPKLSATVTVTVSLWTRPEWINPAPGETVNKPITEGPSSSEQIILLEAEDDDNSGALQYSIVSQDPNTPVMFVVDGARLKQEPGVEFDVDAADATRKYTLNLRVTDGDNTAEADAIIEVSVTDINDISPVFDPSVYLKTVTEDLIADSSILIVTATDADFSDANNKIQYKLEDTSVFAINNTSGVIYLGSTSAVIYDDAPYKLVILATDNGDPTKTASVTATIAVETKPVWIQPAPGQSVNKEIPEDTPFSTVVMTLAAEDKDSSSTPMQYSIHRQDPDTSAVFVIDGHTVKTSPDAQFDVDSSDAVRFFSLYIRVTDGDYIADTDALIKVTVTDINDSPPVFDPSEYSTTITEDLPAGNSVLNVTATDADFTEANNKIEYSLGDSPFTIDSTSGIISVKTPSTVNYDDAPYELVVLAKDNGDPTQSASVIATVAVETKPVWKDPAPGQNKVKQIAEDATNSTVIMKLVAEDRDNSNAPLQYSLISQDPAAPVLFVVVGDTVKPAADAQFDVDAHDAVRSYSLSLRVSDEQYTADAVLEISVTDVNDSPPSFEKSQYSISIPENTQFGDTVIKVSASDDDYSSPNNVITYSLQADTDVFAVNMSDGRIILVKAPDRLEYTLTMKATDYGAPPNSVEVNVTIQIEADAVDECTNVVCLNEGTCQSSVNVFKCNCVAGWSGEFCGNNIDDCAGSPCENEGTCLDGINLFTCNCTEGWKGNTCTEVCSNNKFGRNCEMSCQCVLAKVETTAVEENQLCDISTGACKCKPTWTGHSCETDVDECENATICAAFKNKACGNIDGGYKCGCVRGFIENENNNNECVTDTDTIEVAVEDNETKIDVSFRLNATRKFNLHITLDYKIVKTEIQVRIPIDSFLLYSSGVVLTPRRDLQYRLAVRPSQVLAIMPSVLRVIVRSLESGSLWVNMSLIFQDEEQKKIDTVLKVQEIRDGLSFPLFAETVSTQYLLVEDTPLPAKDPSDKSKQDVCEVYNAAFGCPSGEECGIVNGEPTCEKIPTDNLPLILGLGLGILLPSILLIILIAIYVHIKYRNKTERTIKSRRNRRRYRDKEYQLRPDTNGFYSEDTQEPPYLFYTGDKEINTVSYSSSSIDHVPEGYLYDNKTIPMEW